MTEPCKLRVLSFNIWGLHYIDSMRIRERLCYITQELKNYDLVGLQEVWKRDDFNYMVKELGHVLPYHHYFHSGAIGSGLCIFSRYPIICPHTHQFRVSGSMDRVLDGEMFTGKGVMMCRILTPSGPVAFYTTHMNPRERDSQMFEIYKFVEQTRGRDPVIMTGDYNTKPSQHAYKFLVTALDLQDVYHDDPTDTCDLVSNMFTKKGMTPKRIDFVLYSDSRASSVSLSPEDHSLALTGLIPGKAIPYSDHEGVEATFQVEPRPQEISIPHVTSLDATKVHHFLQLASNIRAKQALVKTTPYKVVTQWVQLGMAVVLLTLVTSYLLHFHPSGYWGLAFVLLGGMAGAGALAIFLVVRSVHNGKTYLCLEANLTEIKTLLTFHTVARAATVIDDCTDMGTKKES